MYLDSGIFTNLQVRCMMVTYFITLFLMFVVLVIGGVLGYVFKDQVRVSPSFQI